MNTNSLYNLKSFDIYFFPKVTQKLISQEYIGPNETRTRDLLTRQALGHLSHATIDIMKTNSLYNLKVSLLCIGTGDERNRDMATVAGEEKKNQRAVDPDIPTRPEHSGESRDLRA
ncbi:hypothetical protein OUZ56_017232 [Daphnia magna]|uniref:Uncharacterized protein n=1 Tax=Daphnia magna TaxID=35525 RepID=A0ABR0ASG6_9CRUS|nr:hypothetical protein OUZ56_017232 [Daphnia magna]